ncbi:L-histidine N(alpha)-methyltransferase [Olleya sp. HaHaR_3_96]|uniref:L-histidine N(alpha)-methyltransferase n=1 Tax=Olleya sp. HaHaR_3_96 TaxID=2745560 RepID=UPI001C4EE584|nr:L-histidine N(alpha)-methyltransferase [Olleya sp. HaHaR_3_96]QXP59153.1 L-histidine N(alpha)-methyltransferase [Olleya sp. HaHaR_3_96]
MNNNFLNDIDKGLSNTPKYLLSKYFYDKKGDALFVDIMNMPEYYLTRAEFDIFKNQTQNIIEGLQLKKDTFFELIELGAGDGTKTKELLKVLDTEKYNFNYIPIDISQNALDQLKESVNTELPHVKTTTKQGDYFEVLGSLKQSNHPKVILFLGSNIGNLSDALAKDFLTKLSDSLKSNDKVLLGLDLIKSKNIVLPAYNDSQGITKRFNLNLLDRINNEFGADFDTDLFIHQPEYTEEEGIARSYLVSTISQNVTIKSLNKTFHFVEGERIHTETSRKYNDTILNSYLENTSLKIMDKLIDSKQYFADYILDKK